MMKTSLCLLLLLLGLSQTQPLVGEESEDDVPDFYDMDISTEDDVIEDNSDMDMSTVDDDNQDHDISTRILTANNGSSEMLLEGDLVLPTTKNAMKCWRQQCLWKKSSNGLVVIPYTVSSAYTSSEKAKIEYALKSFKETTCLRFVPRSNQKAYISVENRGGCYSSLGRTGRKQVLSLNRRGCLSYGTIQHEFNHALGFRHEQTRSDRDKFVRINWSNIRSGVAYNFQKADTNNLNTSYDYSSIMHYGRTAFAIKRGQETITPIPNPRVQIGRSPAMTKTDILRINRLYGCEDPKPTVCEPIY